jgi:hypothetical protein
LMVVPFPPFIWAGTPRMTVPVNADDSWRREATVPTTPDRRLRDRCQAIRMAARGRRQRQITEDVGRPRAHAATLAQRLSSRRARRAHHPVGLGRHSPDPGSAGVGTAGVGHARPSGLRTGPCPRDVG